MSLGVEVPALSKISTVVDAASSARVNVVPALPKISTVVDVSRVFGDVTFPRSQKFLLS